MDPEAIGRYFLSKVNIGDITQRPQAGVRKLDSHVIVESWYLLSKIKRRGWVITFTLNDSELELVAVTFDSIPRIAEMVDKWTWTLGFVNDGRVFTGVGKAMISTRSTTWSSAKLKKINRERDDHLYPVHIDDDLMGVSWVHPE
jgi:hypothetical protein